MKIIIHSLLTFYLMNSLLLLTSISVTVSFPSVSSSSEESDNLLREVSEDQYDEETTLNRMRDMRPDKCPPPPLNLDFTNTNLCTTTRCIQNEDCSSRSYNEENPRQDVNLVCCFNGCVHSCLPEVDPPRAFDWLEETKERIISASLGQAEDRNPNDTSTLENIQPTSGVVISGGCEISNAQVNDLRLFRTKHHVLSCECKNREIVCAVIESATLPSI